MIVENIPASAIITTTSQVIEVRIRRGNQNITKYFERFGRTLNEVMNEATKYVEQFSVDSIDFDELNI